MADSLKSNKKVVLVDGDDWQGLYVNGKLETQGHSVELDDVLKVFGITIDTIYADLDWLSDLGYLPDKLKDVKGKNDGG